MNEVLKETAPDSKLQADWDRQRATAKAVFDRHSNGIHSVLLADEVGMGKTYAALATMATHIFETKENNRKALLIVPNALLSSKWEQEIRTFNRDYLIHRGGKELRPLVVGGYWDLVQNLHDYENIDVPRISARMLKCFAFWVAKWFESRRTAYKRKTVWPICQDLHELHPDVLELSSYLSSLSFSNFLDEQVSLKPDQFQAMAMELKADKDSAFLKHLFRTFGASQDTMEPNIFIVAMSALRRTRSNHVDAQLFASYIVSRALKNRRPPTRLRILASVHANGLVASPDGIPLGKKKHLTWLDSIYFTRLWGYQEAVDSVIMDYGQDTLISELLGDSPGKAMKVISDKIVRQKLAAANIVLAVIDEAHNWKNGGNGAKEFSNVFRSEIPNKLLLSATPFQLHEDELGRVFNSVAAGDDKAISIVHNLLSTEGGTALCMSASTRFQDAWGMLGEADVSKLQDIVQAHGPLNKGSHLTILKTHCSNGDLNESLVAFVEALSNYHHAILGLREALSKIVIRHTKPRGRRHIHAGSIFSRKGMPDYSLSRTSLYPTTGLGDESGALLSYIGMRVEQMVRRDTVRSGREANAHILSGFASSIGAFQQSNKELMSAHGVTDETRQYLHFFDSVLGRAVHPKVAATVERSLSNYRAGSKTLIFCERLATQEEIVRSLREKIIAEDFPSGGVEAVKLRRKEILKDFQGVELYLSRSFRSAFHGVDTPLAPREPTLIELERRGVTLGRLSDRQRNKLLDLLVFDIETSANPSKASAMIKSVLDNEQALKVYLRLVNNPELEPFDDDPDNNESAAEHVKALDDISTGASIWHPFVVSTDFHKTLWNLLENESEQLAEIGGAADPSVFAHLLLDLGQGLRKILLRLDTLKDVIQAEAERPSAAVARMLARSGETPLLSPWHRTIDFLDALSGAQGSIRRPQRHSSRRQSLWKGVYLRDEEIVTELHGDVKAETRISRCAAFNSPLLPDILVCTAIGSEGIDLHLNCDEIIHHDLPWNPARFEQRIGRIDRVGSLGERLYSQDPQRHRLDIGVPFLAFDYDEFQFKTLLSRAQKFEVLLGKPDFTIDVDEKLDDSESLDPALQDTDEAMSASTHKPITFLPAELTDLIRIDLSVARSTD